MRIETKLITDLDRIYEIRDAWTDLVSKSASSWIFSLPEWSIAYLRTFGADCRLHLVLAWGDGELIGVMPLVEKRGKAHDLFLTRLEPIGGQYADYQAPIIKQGLETQLLESLLAYLPQGRKTLLRWPHLPDGHPVLPLLRRYFQSKAWPWFETWSYCYRLPFPKTYQEIENSWDRKHRKEINRQRRRLQKKGLLTLEIIDNFIGIDDWLSDFFEAHKIKWHSEGLPSEFDDVRMRNFYRELTRELSPILHISSLKLDGKRIAFEFGFFFNGWFYDYMATYLQEYHLYSPGNVHFSMLLEHGCARGWKGFDFLQGDESYKRKWTSDGLTCVTFNVGINGGGLPYKWAAYYEPKFRKKFGTFYTRLRFLLKGSKWI